MTYEEALNTLRDFIGCLVPARATILEYRRFEAFDKAIEALEKQISKKPAKQWGNNVCPNCRTDTHCRTVMGWEKHCPDCGQAIDWSDDK